MRGFMNKSARKISREFLLCLVVIEQTLACIIVFFQPVFYYFLAENKFFLPPAPVTYRVGLGYIYVQYVVVGCPVLRVIVELYNPVPRFCSTYFIEKLCLQFVCKGGAVYVVQGIR